MKTSNLRILHPTLPGLLAALGPLGLSLHTAHAATVYACTNFVGLPGVAGSADGIGPGSAARFQYPYGVAVDSTGNVYVADSYNHMFRLVTPARVVTTLAGSAGGSGSADGAGSAARFNYPYGVAVGSGVTIYGADTSNNRISRGVRW